MADLATIYNNLFCDIQFFATTILAALALVALLLTLTLQNKKRIVGVVATVAIAVPAILFSPLCYTKSISIDVSEGQDMGTASKPAPLVESQAAGGIEKYVQSMRAFSKEMQKLEASIAEAASDSLADNASGFSAEAKASKALSIKEKANNFFGRVQRAYVHQDAKEIHQDFIAAAEHLRAAAFALHAACSSEDKAFRDLQNIQQKEQIHLAKEQRQDVMDALSKLAPDFF